MTLEQIKRDLWNAQRIDVLDVIQTIVHDFEHLHELAEAAHAVNEDASDEGAWMFLSGECLDYESPGVPELSNRLAAAIASYGAACAAAERERAAQVVDAAITDLVSRMDPDSEEYYSSVCFHMHQLAAAIRRSP